MTQSVDRALNSNDSVGDVIPRSRLDSFISRLEAQRLCLAAAAEATQGQEGVVLELGLGNGRTYDHLRMLMPDRTIYVFDRKVAAHPDSIPPEDCLFIGEIADTLTEATERLGTTAIVAHADIGDGDSEATRRNAAATALRLPPILQVGAMVASDQALIDPRLEPHPLPQGVPPGRYFMYVRRAVE